MRFSGAGFEREAISGDQNPASPVKTYNSESVSFELPSWMQFSASVDFLNMDLNRATFFGTFQSNNFSNDVFRAGAEYAFDEKYFLRTGYTIDDGQEDYLYGFTAGAGVSLKIGQTDVTFEYSWTQTEFFDNNQYFTGKINF